MRQLSKKILIKMKSYPDFYRKVWTECALIPRGKTITYGELAKNIGSPGAARAVGQALAKNPFAPAVPCHRVVSASGPGGYSGPGGIEKKLKLLQNEKR